MSCFLNVLHVWQAPRISLADGAGSPGSAGSPSAASATTAGATSATGAGQPDGERKSMSLAPRWTHWTHRRWKCHDLFIRCRFYDIQIYSIYMKIYENIWSNSMIGQMSCSFHDPSDSGVWGFRSANTAHRPIMLWPGIKHKKNWRGSVLKDHGVSQNWFNRSPQSTTGFPQLHRDEVQPLPSGRPKDQYTWWGGNLRWLRFSTWNMHLCQDILRQPDVVPHRRVCRIKHVETMWSWWNWANKLDFHVSKYMV